MFSSKQIGKTEFFRYISLFLIFFLVAGGAYSIYENLQSHFYSLNGGNYLTLKTSLLCVINLRGLFFRLFANMWGYIGWQVISPTRWQFLLAGLLTFLVITGLFMVFVRKIPLSNIRLHNNQIVILFSAVLLMFIAMLYFIWEGCDGEIRYTFPVISLFGMLASIGLYFFIDKRKKLNLLMIFPIIFLVSLDVCILNQMDSRYDHGMYVVFPDAKKHEASGQLQSWTPALNAFDSNPKTVWYSSTVIPHGYRTLNIINTHKIITNVTE